MSKIKKENLKKDSSNKNQFDEKFAYRSVIVSAIFAGIFLVISILFNGGVITSFMNINLILTSIDILIKVLAIVLFFFFILTSIANYKELTGKPVNFKMMILLFILSVVQGFRNEWVFSLSLIGLIVILIYFYILQER